MNERGDPPTDDGDDFDLDISLGESRGAERERRTPPDRLDGMAVSAMGAVRTSGLRVYVSRRVCELTERHAGTDTTRELGGVLLGGYYEGPDGPFLQVEDAIPAADAESRAARITFTHDTWAHFTREVERRDDDLQIVGWYHTHPGFGIFLSHHDLFIHRNFFREPWHVALVVDPLADERGYFHWRSGQVAPADGVFLYAPEAETEALSRQANRLRGGRQAVMMAGVSDGDLAMADMFGRRLENVRSYVLLVAIVAFLVMGLNLFVLQSVFVVNDRLRTVSELAAANGPLGRGRALVDVGRYEDAVDELELAALDRDQKPEADYHLYRAYRALGRYDDARRCIADAVAAVPNRYDDAFARLIGEDLRRATPWKEATARAARASIRAQGFTVACRDRDDTALRIAVSALNDTDDWVPLRALLSGTKGDTDVVLRAIDRLRSENEADRKETATAALTAFARRMRRRAREADGKRRYVHAAALAGLARHAVPDDHEVEDDYWYDAYHARLVDLDDVLEKATCYDRLATRIVEKGSRRRKRDVIQALARLADRDPEGNAWARDILRIALTDEDGKVADDALESLVALADAGDWRAIEIIGRHLLSAKERGVRRTCIAALGGTKQVMAVAPLVAAVKSKNMNGRTRRRAVDALADLGQAGLDALNALVVPDGDQSVTEAVNDAKPHAKANALYDEAFELYDSGAYKRALNTVQKIADSVTGDRSRRRLRRAIRRAIEKAPAAPASQPKARPKPAGSQA